MAEHTQDGEGLVPSRTGLEIADAMIKELKGQLRRVRILREVFATKWEGMAIAEEDLEEKAGETKAESDFFHLMEKSV